MARPRALRKKLGAYYLPRAEVMPEQCSTCPFGDPERFAEKRRELGIDPDSSMPGLKSKDDIIHAIDTTGTEFYCHQTVYVAGRPSRPQSEWKVCKGAFTYRRGED